MPDFCVLCKSLPELVEGVRATLHQLCVFGEVESGITNSTLLTLRREREEWATRPPRIYSGFKGFATRRSG